MRPVAIHLLPTRFAVALDLKRMTSIKGEKFMKSIYFLAWCFVASSLISCKLSDDAPSLVGNKEEDSLEQRVSAIQRDARQTLGVDVVSLGVLANTDGSEYLLKDSLDHLYRERISALESAGYVKISEITAEEGVFINLSLTESGRVLQAILND